MVEKTCGIYCFENIIDNKKYIGYSNNICRRKKEHIYCLNKGTHNNRHFQFAWNKYGEENFIFYVLEECELELLKERETYYIKIYRELNQCYNLNDGGNGSYNISDETRLLLSYATNGVVVSEKTRMRMSEAWRNRVISEESKKRMSISRMGNTNRRGRKQINAPSSSKYVGVCWNNDDKKWRSQIKLQGKKINLGSFVKEEDAALAYDKKALEVFGDNAILNFDIDFVRMTELPLFGKDKCSSKYRGVSLSKAINKWVAYIDFNKEHFHIGSFDNELLAAIAYNEAAIEFYGFNAILNLITEKEYNLNMINS
jgi:group I intron endonuclease